MTQCLDIGTIIEGTHRPQDLLPAFIEALRTVDPGRAEAADRAFHPDAQEEDNHLWFESLDCSTLCNVLQDMLSEYAPPYCYFGTLEGDGACFGCWIDHDAIRDAIHDGDMLQVSDLAEAPDDWSSEVLHVNDHGNMTLYARGMDQEYHEVWAVV